MVEIGTTNVTVALLKTTVTFFKKDIQNGEFLRAKRATISQRILMPI